MIRQILPRYKSDAKLNHIRKVSCFHICGIGIPAWLFGDSLSANGELFVWCILLVMFSFEVACDYEVYKRKNA